MITTLFTDLGGVLLTNGWDRGARKRASEHFGLDVEDVNERHHLTYDTYEIGRLSLDDYLNRVVFYEPRDFSREDFRTFMFGQSKPIPEMIEFVKALKAKHNLRVVAISNEGRELAQHRIDKFRLRDFIDVFFVSGFLHMRKPNAGIFEFAIDAVQAPLQHAVYLDDRQLFVEVANGLGLQAVRHIDLETTKAKLAELGLNGVPSVLPIAHAEELSPA